MKKRLCIVLFLIIIIVVIFFLIDYNRVKKQELPIFCIKSPKGVCQDGGTVEYIGLGYKVIDFNTLSGYDEIKIGSWFMKYSDFDNEIKSYEGNNLKEDNEVKDEVNARENQMDEIINRFYAEDYKRLTKLTEENSNKMSLNELLKQDYAVELLNIIIDIIENKDITIEEKDILKEFLLNQYYFLEKGSDMQIKVSKILNIN